MIQSRLLAAALIALPGLVAAEPVLIDVSGVGAVYDKVLLVQPIHVCSSDGQTCGPTTAHHPDTTIRTLAQARIATALLPMRSIVSDAMVVMHMPDEEHLLTTPGHGQSLNQQTLNAWFVHNLFGRKDDDTPFTALGMVAGFPDPQGSLTPNSVLLRRLGDRKAITFAHELAHALGLQHVQDDANNLMAEGLASNFQANLTAGQIAHMRTSGFLAAVPEIRLTSRTVAADTDHEMTELRIEHVATPGAAEVGLRELTLDLSDLLSVQPGPAQPPARQWASLAVVDDSTLSARYTVRYNENMVIGWPCKTCGDDLDVSSTGGLPELGIDFGEDGLAPGQFITLRLGITTNLRNEYEFTTGRGLSGGMVDLHFDHGLSARVDLDAAAAPGPAALMLASPDLALLDDDDLQRFDLRAFSGIYSEGRYGNPFGAQYTADGLPSIRGTWEVDFPAELDDEGPQGAVGRIPEPRGAALLAAALVALVAFSRGRPRCRPATAPA